MKPRPNGQNISSTASEYNSSHHTNTHQENHTLYGVEKSSLRVKLARGELLSRERPETTARLSTLNEFIKYAASKSQNQVASGRQVTSPNWIQLTPCRNEPGRLLPQPGFHSSVLGGCLHRWASSFPSPSQLYICSRG